VGVTNPLPARDQALADRLTTAGYTVVVRSESQSATSDANGKDLVIISDSVTSGNVNTKFRDVAVSVINWEPSLYDDMMMAGTTFGTNYGDLAGQTQIVIASSGHPMAAGLSGTVATTLNGQTYFWAVPSANADVVSTLVGYSGRASIFAYEAGDAMVGMNAPARRVGFFNGYGTDFTAAGWALWDEAVEWALNCQPGPTATPTFTATPVPPTATPTFTATPVPPTATPTFTATPVPPTATPTFTATPVPPTATPTFTATPVPPTPTPTATPAAALYVSSTSGGTVGGVSFADEDILALNTGNGQWSMLWDGSDVGVTVDLTSFSRQPDGSFLMSFESAVTITGLGAVDDSDIVRFLPTTLGSTTSGSFEWYFDGSDVGLEASSEDIDAISFTPAGDLVISTTGGNSVPGVAGADEDLLVFSATQLGANTAGSWAMYFDGSDVGLSQSSSEDVNGAWIDVDSGEIYLTALGAFSVAGVSGDGADIFVCTPTSLGTTTACTFGPGLFWDGSASGFAGELLDGFEILP